MDAQDITLRIATLKDLPAMTSLFRETVWHINSRSYTPDQVRVWAAAADHTERWVQKLHQQFVILAMRGDDLLGFGSLRQDYVDLLYVHKDWQGKGVAGLIYDVLEQRAKVYGMQALATDASVFAMPFFAKKGYMFVTTRYYVLDGVEISNSRMVKSLH